MDIKTFFYYFVKALNIALTVVVVVFFLFFGYIFYCNIAKMPVPQLGPIRMFVVLSDSMVPTFKTDDAVLVIETPPEKLNVDDVIAFYAFEQDVAITHRIIKIEKTAGSYNFKTKGDNNTVADSFVTPDSRIIGKYFWHIPNFNTYLTSLKETPYVIAFPIILLVVLQSIFNYLEKKLKPEKKEKVAVLAEIPPKGDDHIEEEHNEINVSQDESNKAE